MYSFEYKGANSMIHLLLNQRKHAPDTGVCHGDELFYLFHLRLKNSKRATSNDQLMSQKMVKLWTDFAKYG
jgi:esterase, putative (fragment)